MAKQIAFAVDDKVKADFKKCCKEEGISEYRKMQDLVLDYIRKKKK